MSSLDQIEVMVEGEENPEMVRSVLSEITALLECWLTEGKPGVIDLQGLPLTATDYQLEEKLGRGEVSITIQVLGKSQILETAFPGVWYVIHRDEVSNILTKQIEVIDIPSIVLSQRVEMEQALERLKSDSNMTF